MIKYAYRKTWNLKSMRRSKQGQNEQFLGVRGRESMLWSEIEEKQPWIKEIEGRLMFSIGIRSKNLTTTNTLTLS